MSRTRQRLACPHCRALLPETTISLHVKKCKRIPSGIGGIFRQSEESVADLAEQYDVTTYFMEMRLAQDGVSKQEMKKRAMVEKSKRISQAILATRHKVGHCRNPHCGAVLFNCREAIPDKWPWQWHLGVEDYCYECYHLRVPFGRAGLSKWRPASNGNRRESFTATGSPRTAKDQK